MPPAVTWCSCMAWSSAACVLGGVRLISSARTTLAKTGPCTKRNARFPVVRSSSMISVPVMSLGMRSGRELDPVEREVQRLGDGLHHQRLREARHPDEQRMPARQHRREDPLDHVVLAHDPLGHLAPKAGDRAHQALELADVVRALRARLRSCRPGSEGTSTLPANRPDSPASGREKWPIYRLRNISQGCTFSPCQTRKRPVAAGRDLLGTPDWGSSSQSRSSSSSCWVNGRTGRWGPGGLFTILGAFLALGGTMYSLFRTLNKNDKGPPVSAGARYLGWHDGIAVLAVAGMAVVRALPGPGTPAGGWHWVSRLLCRGRLGWWLVTSLGRSASSPSG